MSPGPSISRPCACAATAIARRSPPPGLPELDGFYLAGVWSEAWGREAVARLFDSGRGAPDALFCGNDQIARGAADALRERGIAVPDDVAIVGFDNWDVMALAARPPLTSIDMNLQRPRAARPASRLLEMIAGRAAARRPAAALHAGRARILTAATGSGEETEGK